VKRGKLEKRKMDAPDAGQKEGRTVARKKTRNSEVVSGHTRHRCQMA
jgi:hypothetical protein